jgi:hypothetical protein
MQNHLHIGGAKDGLLFPAADDAEIAPGFDLYIRDSLSVGDVSISFYRHESLTRLRLLNGQFCPSSELLHRKVELPDSAPSTFRRVSVRRTVAKSSEK